MTQLQKVQSFLKKQSKPLSVKQIAEKTSLPLASVSALVSKLSHAGGVKGSREEGWQFVRELTNADFPPRKTPKKSRSLVVATQDPPGIPLDSLPDRPPVRRKIPALRNQGELFDQAAARKNGSESFARLVLAHEVTRLLQTILKE